MFMQHVHEPARAVISFRVCPLLDLKHLRVECRYQLLIPHVRSLALVQTGTFVSWCSSEFMAAIENGAAPAGLVTLAVRK